MDVQANCRPRDYKLLFIDHLSKNRSKQGCYHLRGYQDVDKTTIKLEESSICLQKKDETSQIEKQRIEILDTILMI